MTNFYWIIAQHSGKVLEVEGASIFQPARIIQVTKKSEHDPIVDAQLWYFNGGFIANKRSGFMLDVAGAKYVNGTQIIQYVRYAESCAAQEWDYNHEDNTISLKHDRKFVLDVSGEKIILYEKHGSKNQQFILQKWNDCSTVIENTITSIIDNCKFLPKLSQNFLEILNDDEYYDVNIEVGSDPHVRTFHAHTVILYYRSSFLRRMLSTNKKNNDGTLARIELPNILPEIFEIILRYIYGGRLSLKECDTKDIIKLLVAANELNLQELIAYIQSFLIENKADWMEENFDLIYRTSSENESFLDLQKFCNDLISNEPNKIFGSPNFTSIPEKLLISVIRDDYLQMSEIQVWEHVLKWGIAQNPELPSDLTKITEEEDFQTLGSTLKLCIPLIRFYNLTSKEFAEKVYPFKKVLPEKLLDDLLLSLLNPDNKKGESKPRIPRNIDSRNIDSTIITSQHVESISKWVDKLDELTTPYDRIVDNQYAIDNISFYGPSFGNGDLIIWGLDISTFNYYCKVCKNSYERSIRETEDRFYVEEYEVFQLMKIYS
ncbi:BTB/POZ protein [Rhizophagus irregularis DAOM 181602=DAOM 197198]|nr:BTB/POZ protein [Rhizophagus irregularis DAOM 181602=DAOM 197198]